MAQFEAEIRLQDLSDVDALTARRAVEEKLRAAGFARWTIIRIGPQRAGQRLRPRPMIAPVRRNLTRARVDAGQGVWVVIASVAWAIWFVWLLSGG